MRNKNVFSIAALLGWTVSVKYVDGSLFFDFHRKTLSGVPFSFTAEMKDRKLKRSLDFANRENIPYVIILGEDEINNKKFVLKDMFGSNNIDVSMDNLDVIKDCLK